MQPSEQYAVDYPSDVARRCPGPNGDTLLAKTSRKIYLVASLGFILRRSIRFCI